MSHLLNAQWDNRDNDIVRNWSFIWNVVGMCLNENHNNI